VFSDEEKVYHNSNRAPLSSPSIRRLRASVSQFGCSDGYFRFRGSGTFIIRKTLMQLGFEYRPATGYTLYVPPALRSSNAIGLGMQHH
jgi:hypothetical protein